MLPLEPLIGAVAIISGFFTWSHSQRQQVLNMRFQELQTRLDKMEEEMDQIPLVFATKEDVNNGMSDIKAWLARIDQKLDRVILKEHLD